MNEALTYIYLIYSRFISLVFTDFALFNGVTIGWVLISVLVFGILIRSILNLPKGVSKRG